MAVDIDLQRLRAFVAVAEQLHFGRAARALQISRPALSHTIIDLETELGVKLFVPGAQPTELTEAGRTLLEQAREPIAADDERVRELAEAAAAPLTFTIGFVPGVTLSKWTRKWSERVPGVPLEVVGTTVSDQAAVLHDGRVDVSFVRLPVEREGLSVIPLYSEMPVVVVPKDHPVSLFDQVTAADLADDRHLPIDGSVADALELVAAGVGIVIVPQSVARLYSRRDLVYRPVTDLDHTQIALAWLAERTTEQIEEFVGIVRGRSPRSSRAQPTQPRSGKSMPRASKPAKEPSAGKAQSGRSQPRGATRNTRRSGGSSR